MAYTIFLIPTVIFFVINGFGYLIYAIKLNKVFPKSQDFGNNIIIVAMWFFAGLSFPYLYTEEGLFANYFHFLMSIIVCVFAPVLIIAIVLYGYIKFVESNNKTEVDLQYEIFYQGMTERAVPEKRFNYSLKVDIRRKSFHLLPVAVVIILWIFAVHVWDGFFHFNSFWRISGEEYGVFLILTVGFTGVVIFAALDYLRLSYIFNNVNWYCYIPRKIFNLLNNSIKEREFFSFIRPVALVLSFVPVFFLPISIFTSAMLISTIGDGAASIFGLKFGKIKFPKKSNKTIVGYIAGFVSSLIVSLLSFLFFEPKLGIISSLLLALVGALVFLAIDLINLRIDDNILNPIICGFLMFFVYLFFI